MSGGAGPGVGRTAVWTAGLRAAESARPDRLLDDPYAAVFVAAYASGGVTAQTTASGGATAQTAPAGGLAAETASVPPGASEFLAIRTRFYDDQVRAATAAGLRQIVLLAAGLDCRALRLGWPDGVRLFELDLPEVFAFKQPVLASLAARARCVRRVVAVDLREPWSDPLTAAGFDPGAPTGWLAEGLLPYLSRRDGDRLLATVTDLPAPGSRAAVDHIEASAAERPAVRATSDAVRRMGARLLPTEDSPEDWLAAHGWRTRLFRVPALGEEYARPLPAEVDPVASNATALVAATR